MALGSEQQHVLSTILRIGRQRGATPKEIKAAIETGLVESGLRNLPGGSGDSAGWRQERASLYPNPTNLTASVNRFFDETASVRDKYGTAGSLAAAVQRPDPRFRGRYQERSGEAQSLLGAPTGGGSGGGLASALQGSVTPGTSSGTGFDPGSPQDVGLTDLLSQSPAPVAAAVPSPPAQRSYLRMSVQPPVVSPSAPQGGGGLDNLLSALGGPQELPAVSTTGATTDVSGSVAGDSGRGSTGARVASGHSPVAANGKIIGTPYTGTHTLGNWQSDRAYDIAVPKGTPMVALQDGVIVKVTRHPQGSGRFAGDQITVRGANGNEYFYAHGVASVRPGQRIRRGQQLGVTGSANGVAHLHFAQMKGDPSMHVR